MKLHYGLMLVATLSLTPGCQVNSAPTPETQAAAQAAAQAATQAQMSAQAAADAAALAAFQPPTNTTLLQLESYKGNAVTPGVTQMNRWIAITTVGETRTGDLYTATVRAESVSDQTADFEYRFLWFKDGIQPVEETAPAIWRRFRLHGKQIKEFNGIAPDKRANSFRFEVRYIANN